MNGFLVSKETVVQRRWERSNLCKNEDDLTELRKRDFSEKRLGSIFQRHHIRALHHTSIEFFLDSFKNMNFEVLESPK